MTAELSLRQARRLAIAAQGLAEPRPKGAVDRRHLAKLMGRLGALQIDSVNVVARSHYLPPFARLGPYPRALLEREAWGKKPSLFEYWGHAASLMPIELQPLLRWRMARAEAGEVWSGMAAARGYAEQVLAEIEKRGPVTGGDFAEGKRTPGWWNWSRGKSALEWLFYCGRITTRTRRGFERVYDLTERVLPSAIVNAPTPREEDAHRALLVIAARAMGVADEADLRDYFRMPAAETRARLAELVEDGALRRVSVEGWSKPGYIAAGAKLSRRVADGALLSPFDNLIWRRERTERLFGARVRLEIYTPSEKREHGYYVLPFLMGETITARVDLKADRAARTLLVQAAHREAGADAGEVAPALAAELGLMARWLELDEVRVVRRGDLAAPLAAALKSRAR